MTDAKADLAARRDRLLRWLTDACCPLWSTAGIDPANGGFVERLAQDGLPLDEPRRARVQPRQLYSFATASALGWNGPLEKILRQGLAQFRARYRRPDGLMRTLVASDGAVIDDSVVLYDQAFALLGLCAVADALGDDGALEAEATDLVARLIARQKHRLAGFDETPDHPEPLLSNPHMHLFEACQAWSARSAAPRWRALADEIAGLAADHFIDPANGMLREFFDSQWRPVAGPAGRIVEPGHQYEWAWLLIRWAGFKGEAAPATALRLIDIGEAFGVDAARAAAVNSLLDDGSVHDAGARLWPQTERLKAACAAASMTGVHAYWRQALEAADCMLRYLDTQTPGLWRDKMRLDGSFIDEPAPASSLYHIVAAIAELDRVLAAPDVSGRCV